MTKNFLTLAVILLLFGGSVGGAFIGGIEVGKNQSESSINNNEGLIGLNSSTQTRINQLPEDSQNLRGQLRERIEQARESDGTLSPEIAERLRQEFLTGMGEGEPTNPSVRGGITGNVENITDNSFFVDTNQGSLQVRIIEKTNIFRLTLQEPTSITLEDLVLVNGERAEEGGLLANSVVIAPAGSQMFPDLGIRVRIERR